MENFHSTADLRLERNSSLGVRVVVSNVTGANTKNNKITTTISNNIDMSDGDIYRAFFKKLDNDEIKTQQGGILRCDKKRLYYVDDSFEFPKGFFYDEEMSNMTKKPYFRYKAARFENGLKALSKTSSYRNIHFEVPDFTGNIVELAKHIHKNLNVLRTDNGETLVEYEDGYFERVPDPGIKLTGKFPKNIKIKSVNSTEKVIKVEVKTTENTINFDYSIKNISPNLFKTVYAFYVARDIYDGNVCEVKYNKELDVFESNSPVEEDIETNTTVEDFKEKRNEENVSVIFDPTSEDAKSLIGKRVFYSNSINNLDSNVGILDSIDTNDDFPFLIRTKTNPWYKAIFIKKSPDLEVKCYDFNDLNTRLNLFGKIFKTKNSLEVEEEMVTSFKKINDRWVLNGKITAYKLFTNYQWIDGSDCGIIVDPLEVN